MKIVFFGEALVELNHSPRHQTYGGNVVNRALYLARLGGSRAINVSYATCIGIEKTSMKMLQCWQQENIDTSLVKCLATKYPNLCFIETDNHGQCHYHYWNKDNAMRYYFSYGPALLHHAVTNNDYDAIYISGGSVAALTDDDKTLLLSLLDIHKKKGGKVYLDNSFRADLWSTRQAQYWYGKIFPYVDIAFIDLNDEMRIWGSSRYLTQRYIQWGCREVVFKQANNAECTVCSLVIRSDTLLRVASIKLAVKDGDQIVDNAFVAGYLAARINRQTISQSLLLAQTLSHRVTTCSDAIIPSDSMRDIM
ncbi:PfkB family carbohydrate kinase [Photobacterium toruni]|mgnify:CR=1 FL=1|uniref:2-dehydro-3-deoxygluconokinase n=1 Tax=Photobacterium toruni TaxID=1935446 RepID=A0A1T4PHV3_9GAMM|nr:PfkB family carbohydrate kinase [Photobacterium toruni]MEC6816873.1 PfkB family carbohydrate kinase [Photobacterium toruni]MEC6832139.1 PfkB family carbohydrate kinase [Photobacterium toruni]SJZ91150.1 2-dehydro-3-deoxygluconokinase [Photobacterium toruni]